MVDYLQRLALALPLICLLAAGGLVVWRRLQCRFSGRSEDSGARLLQGIRLPQWFRRADPASKDSAGTSNRAALTVLRSQTVAPGARLLVVRFGGGDHLIGLSSAGLKLLAKSSASRIAPDQDILASIVGHRLEDTQGYHRPATASLRARS